jgi:hypothetical protein
LERTPGQRRARAQASTRSKKLAVCVSLGPVPAASCPVEVVEIRIAASVHARTEVHQPTRRIDESGQQVGGEDVDRKDLRKSVDGLDAPGFAVADAGVVDDRVIAA